MLFAGHVVLSLSRCLFLEYDFFFLGISLCRALLNCLREGPSAGAPTLPGWAGQPRAPKTV